MPRDVSLSDSKCWNGGHEWVKRDLNNITVIANAIFPKRKIILLLVPHFKLKFCKIGRIDLKFLKF